MATKKKAGSKKATKKATKKPLKKGPKTSKKGYKKASASSKLMPLVYTRSVPPPIADRRIGEIDADLHDHIAHERAHGTKDRRIALGIAVRMLRGVAADASWRGEMLARSSTPKEVMKMSGRSYVRVGLMTGGHLDGAPAGDAVRRWNELGRVRLRLRRAPPRRNRPPDRVGARKRPGTSASRSPPW